MTKPRSRWRSGHRARRETGSATVLVLGGVGVVVTVLTGVLLVASAVRDMHRARSAADLAALAGASAAREGRVVDCVSSSAVAEANGARMRSCSLLVDGSVLVDVDVPMRWPAAWSALPDRATARARAGVVSGSDPDPETAGRP